MTRSGTEELFCRILITLLKLLNIIANDVLVEMLAQQKSAFLSIRITAET